MLINNDPLKRYFKSINYNYFNIYTIGITGSCGKTTTSLLLYYFLKDRLSDVCYIGTHKILYNDLAIETKNTTVEIDILANYFKKYNIKPKYIIMEVSSIGINEARINSFKFNILALTNLGSDHLDYHLNINNYHHVKLAFLNSAKYTNKIFINKTYKDKFAFNNKNIKFYDENIDILNSFNTISFNKHNFYLVYEILRYLNYKNDEIISYLNTIKLNNGRAEIIKYNNKNIIIDYAHHVESFKAILDDNNFNKVVVFGCGGNRDKFKRSIIGKIVSTYAKHVIITKDNSRFENIDEIIKDIIKDISNYKIIKNRKEAIEYALNNYPNLDIFILGKGDETYIEENGEMILFNDKECVLNYIKNHIV